MTPAIVRFNSGRKYQVHARTEARGIAFSSSRSASPRYPESGPPKYVLDQPITGFVVDLGDLDGSWFAP